MHVIRFILYYKSSNRLEENRNYYTKEEQCIASGEIDSLPFSVTCIDPYVFIYKIN